MTRTQQIAFTLAVLLVVSACTSPKTYTATCVRYHFLAPPEVLTYTIYEARKEERYGMPVWVLDIGGRRIILDNSWKVDVK